MNNANPAGIQNAANQIQSVVNSANSLVETIENACENLLNANSLLTSYSGQIVAGTKEPYYKQVTNEETGEVREVRLGDKADFWTGKLNGYVEDNVGRVKDYANEINNIVTSLNSEAIGMDRVAEAIDGYINSVESSIINGVGPTYLSADVLSNAFKAIGQESASKGNLARSGSDVNSGNLLDYSEIESTGLANTKLSFVLQDDGSYKVYSNGKETEYYTTALAAAFYQKTLKTLVNSNTKTDTKSTEEVAQAVVETVSGTVSSAVTKVKDSVKGVIENDKVKEVANKVSDAIDEVSADTASSNSNISTNVEFTDNLMSVEDLDDSTKKEIWEYCYSQNFDKTESEKSKVYNNLSDLAKKIVDREIIVFSPIDGSTYSLSDFNNIEIK